MLLKEVPGDIGMGKDGSDEVVMGRDIGHRGLKTKVKVASPYHLSPTIARLSLGVKFAKNPGSSPGMKIK